MALLYFRKFIFSLNGILIIFHEFDINIVRLLIYQPLLTKIHFSKSRYLPFLPTKACRLASGSDALIKNQTLYEPSELSHYLLKPHRFRSLTWPCGVAEQCSRHREKGAHCLSAASLHAAGPALSKAEGVGEPHRAPEERHQTTSSPIRMDSQ